MRNILVVRITRFPNQYYIEETGLYYNWWRWYGSKIKRYVAKDQFILYDTFIFKIVIHINILTVFIYSMNNPFNRVGY